MQTDFREERRWKIALAYELAICVQEWHIAGSKEERVRLGITGAYKKPDPVDYVPSADDDQVEIPVDEQDADSGSDDEFDADIIPGLPWPAGGLPQPVLGLAGPRNRHRNGQDELFDD